MSLPASGKEPEVGSESSQPARVTTDFTELDDERNIRSVFRSVAPLSSFAATQHYKSVQRNGSYSKPQLDHDKTSQHISQLLELRRTKMKDASRNGDNAELYRLQNLSLFEEVEIGRKKSSQAQKFKTKSYGTRNKSNAKEEIKDDLSSIPHQESKLPMLTVNKGEEGAFGNCPVACSKTRIRVDQISLKVQNLPAESDGLSTISATSLGSARPLIAKFPEPPSNGSSTTVIEEMNTYQDLFLSQLEGPQFTCRRGTWTTFSDPQKGTSLQPKCGSPSCERSHECPRQALRKGCCLPKPHPTILAAMERVKYFQGCPITMQLNQDLGLIGKCPLQDRNNAKNINAVWQRIPVTMESAIIRQMLSDMTLVDMYTAEMRRRCSKGVWWEGWLVVHDLRRQGIVGSVPATIS